MLEPHELGERWRFWGQWGWQECSGMRDRRSEKKQKNGGKDHDSHPVMNWSLDHAEEAKVLGPRVSLSP